jgi:K+-sensing histidine kinase KdpD
MLRSVHFERSAAARYIGAAAAVLAALGIRLALDEVLSRHSPYLVFVLAIIVAARFGGRGPALSATALSVLAAWYFVVEPRRSFAIADPGALAGLAWFAVVGSLVSLLVGRLRRALLDSVRREEFIRHLFESMEEGFALLETIHDAAGKPCDFRYLAVNPAFGRLTGREVEAVVGRRVREVFPDIEPFWIEAYNRVVKTGVAERIGGYRAGLGKFLEASARRSGPGQLAAVVRDVTARHKAEEEIRTLNATLERRVEERTAQLLDANRELEAFSYSVSHDLRAPLRSVDGFARILLRDYPGKPLDEIGAGYLNRMSAASQRMGQLIADLLELARISRLELSPRTVDLSAMALWVLDDLRNRDLDRTVDIRIQPGLAARADERMLRVALTNLFGNAWKFTGKTAAPSIAFGAAPADAAESVDRGAPVYFVRDNGAGFDMTNAQKLFAPFQRFHAQEEFEGTGIGLATVQRIVRRHGGRIWAESQPGQGATFYFTLGGD